MNDTTNQVDDSCCNAGPEPLPRFHHPEHGELTIYGFDGRSKLCRRVSDGAEFRIGTRIVNRLRSAAARTIPLPLDQTIVGDALSTVNLSMAEKLPDVVRNLLEVLPDGPERTRIARDVRAAADAFLST